MSEDEEHLVERLAEGLAPSRRGPSQERVDAVRAHAQRRRAELGSAPAPPPVSLADRRGRREVLTGAVAAAMGAALGAVGLEAVDDDPPAVPTAPVPLAVAAAGVEAEAVSIDHTWGVEVVLTATGLVPGRTYRAAVQPAGGGPEVSAGSFLGVDAVPVVCRMNAAVLRDAAASFSLVDDEGATVLIGRFV